MKKLICFIVAVVAFLPLVALNAWAVQTLWEWFIIPEFGVPPLSFIGAIGLALFVSYMTFHFRQDLATNDDSWEVKYGSGLALAVVKPLFSVGAGWLYLAVFS